jgi:hypothetical protein
MRGVGRVIRAFWTFPDSRPVSVAFAVFGSIRSTRGWALRCFVESALTPRELFGYEVAARSDGARRAVLLNVGDGRYALAVEYLVANAILPQDEAAP